MTARRAVAAISSDLQAIRVREAVAGCLGLAPETVAADTPLAAYGVDSLAALEMVTALEDRFERVLPESLLTDSPTLADLCAYLAKPDEPVSTSGDCGLRQRLRRDALLPPDIRPRSARPSDRLARRVLLTGATGFLGSALLRAFLDRQYQVVCLVRPDGGDPRRRLEAVMRRYGLWREADEGRFDVVAGDLEHPCLGLDAATYVALAASVTDISHAAADVSWVAGYETLHAANVGATVSLLRFACTGTVKRFQFISSLSVCFATNGPAAVAADADMQEHCAELPLGYAQSKCVGESLVRQAADRGLGVQIVRPALLAGHSDTGLANLDDLISRLLKGCIQLGAAPDLDWSFDAVPVDTAAHAIVDSLEATPSASAATLVLSHPRPRHWRECVLWMNLFGYRIELEPYDAWVERLRRDRRPQLALHRLRGFFTRRIAGRTVPEHFQEHVRTHVHPPERAAVEYPPLDANRLEAYFRSFIRRGFVDPPVDRPSPHAAAPAMPELHARLEDVLQRHYGHRIPLRTVVIERLTGHSIIGELTSWRTRQQTGLFRCRIEAADGVGDRPASLVVKLKPPDDDVIAIAETMASMCDRAIAREMRLVRHRLGIAGGRQREVAIYGAAKDTGLDRYMPACFGTWMPRGTSGEADVAGLVLEQLDGLVAMDAADDPGQWTDACVETAIDGLADIHSVCTRHVRAFEASDWIGYVPSAASAVDMVGLWRALATHAAEPFRAWVGDSLAVRHRLLVETVRDWWPVLEQTPRTLVHHDFNPRNIALRRTDGGQRLVAYDWELATLHAPQRDLAELLCFVLPPDVSAKQLDRWVERHRQRFTPHTGEHTPSRLWRAGFRSALHDFLVSRLALYALVHRVSPQPFLPRVVRTWARLDELMRVTR